MIHLTKITHIMFEDLLDHVLGDVTVDQGGSASGGTGAG